MVLVFCAVMIPSPARLRYLLRFLLNSAQLLFLCLRERSDAMVCLLLQLQAPHRKAAGTQIMPLLTCESEH